MSEYKPLTCFKAYDIRGRLGDELNEDIAYRIGRAYGEFLKPKQVVVGSDVRLTSESLKLALSHGLQDAGVNVIDLGLTGTEEVYFATFHLQVDGGIEITASHNPIDYNGMKLVKHEAQPISGDSGLTTIREIAEKGQFVSVNAEHRGTYEKIDLADDYVDHLMGYIDCKNLKPLKIVINSGNGAAGHVIDKIDNYFRSMQVPIEIIKIHHHPDGNFPNGIPNPLLPECRQDTTDAVLLHQADLGIAFDGDFDRCFFFDEKGRFIEGYYIVGLLAQAFLLKEKNARIIHDPRLTWNTIDIIQSLQGVAVMSKTGHAFIKERMRKEDAIYGGEMSAHHYFRDFAYCDSGMIPWLLVIELLSLQKYPLSHLVNERISAYPVSGEINRVVSDPKKVIERIKAHFLGEALHFDKTDGISMEFDNWRFNLRTSNTEPVIRLNVESKKDINLMEEKTKMLLAMLE